MEVLPTTVPSGDIVMPVKCGGLVNATHPWRPKMRWWGTVVDKFGNTYPIGKYEDPIFTTLFPWNTGEIEIVADNCCYAYTDSTDVVKWNWGQSNNSPQAESDIAGVLMDIDLSTIPDMVWETGFTFKISFNIHEATGEFAFYDSNLYLYEVQLLKLSEFKADKIYTDVKGRKKQDEVTFIETLPEVYEHCLKLQNYSNRGVDTPVDGWGINYPDIADWSTFYSSADIAALAGFTTNFQVMNSTNARTDKMKAELCRLMWAIGYTDRSGVERIKPMIDGLYNDDGVLITYGDLYQGQLPTDTDRKFSDVLTDMTFDYSYNTATEKNNESFVVDISKSGRYGDMSRVLYGAYKVTNKATASIGNCNWINTTEELELYATQFYNWQGVFETDIGVFIARKRYSTKIKLPYTFIIDNDIDIATPIRLQIPQKTYFGATPANHSGIVTAINEDAFIENPTATITVEMLGDDLAGADRTIYTETGSADIEILETGSQSINILEGNYGD
jgi:hypothetical protein